MKIQLRKLFGRTLGAATLSAAMIIPGVALAQSDGPAPDSPRADPTDKRGSRGVDEGENQNAPSRAVQPRAVPQQGQVIENQAQTNETDDKVRGLSGKLVDPERPVLGIRINDDGDGVKITEVKQDSPAAKAGLKVGDHVTKINDKQVGSTKELISHLQSMKKDEDVKLVILREGEEQNITAGLAVYTEIFETAQSQQGQRREVLRPNLDDEQNRRFNEVDRDAPRVDVPNAQENAPQPPANTEDRPQADDLNTEEKAKDLDIEETEAKDKKDRKEKNSKDKVKNSKKKNSDSNKEKTSEKENSKDQ